jgi:hypothetical protein
MKKLYIAVFLMVLSSMTYSSQRKDDELVSNLLATLKISRLSDRDFVNSINHKSTSIAPGCFMTLMALRNNNCRLDSIERKYYVLKPNEIIFNMKNQYNIPFKFIVDSKNNRYYKKINGQPVIEDQQQSRRQNNQSPSLDNLEDTYTNPTYTGEESI